MKSDNQIQLREFQKEDIAEVLQLFYDTVTEINSRDYAPEQITAWIQGVDEQRWLETLLIHTTLVAVRKKEIVGFADMDASGYLDRLYIHRHHQGEGIATALCDALEAESGADCISVHASITAREFFLQRGYRLIRSQQAERQGQLLTNYVMEKVRI